MMTWMWRGILVSVALFLVFGMARFWTSFPELLKGDVRQPSVTFEVQARVIDALEGIVSADVFFHPFKIFPSDRFIDSSYPLSYQVCLFAALPNEEPLSLECWKRYASQLSDLEPVMQFQESFFIPSAVAEFHVSAQLSFQDALGEKWGDVSTIPQTVRWIPETRLKLVDGRQLEPGETVSSPDVVFFISRNKDVSFTRDGVSILPSLIVDPKPQGSFLPIEDGGVSFFQWVYPVSASQTSPSFQLCARSVSGQPQCFLIQSGKTVADVVSLCGNGVLEKGEECDDPLDERCTPQCVLKTFQQDALEYPSSRVSVEKVDENRFSFFARLEPSSNLSRSVDPRQLFIRFETESGLTGLSTDSQRINGYPFLQSFFPSHEFITVEFFQVLKEQEYVFHTSLVNTSSPVPEVSDVRSAAGENPFFQEEAIGDIGLLQVKWLGSDQTEIVHERREVIDLTGRQDFSSRVVVQSTFEQSLKLTISLADESISFVHTLPPRSSEEIPLHIPNFSYGNHRFVVSAVMPDGLKTADIVFPFLYRSESLVNELDLEWWQMVAIGILFLLGVAYSVFRIGLWRSRVV